MKMIALSASVLAFLAGNGFAADLPSFEATPAASSAAMVHTWTGFYAGVHAGYGWGESDFDFDSVTDIDPDDLAEFNSILPFDNDLDGAIAGAQAEFNLQVRSFVFGLEADASWSGMADEVSYEEPFGPEGPDISYDVDVNWLASVRGRAGFAADRFMIYGTGGIAWADINSEVTANIPEGPTFSDDDTNTQMGWVAGLGVESRVTDMVSVRAEYLHYDFGNDDRQYDVETGSVEGNADLDFDVVRLGVNVLLSGF